MSIEYNDFGFTAMDADELASVDTKIVEKTTTATEVINKLDNFIRPLLENLAKKIEELDLIQKNI